MHMNILVLTKTYPNPEDHELDGTTPVVKDFAVAWAAAGHRVFVYHNYTKKPGVMNLLPATAIEAQIHQDRGWRPCSAISSAKAHPRKRTGEHSNQEAVPSN